jgi:hypothetical protein
MKATLWIGETAKGPGECATFARLECCTNHAGILCRSGV